MNELFDYWRDYPPIHVLAAAYLMGGSKGSAGKRSRRGRAGEAGDHGNQFHDLAQAISSAGGSTHQKLPGIYKN